MNYARLSLLLAGLLVLISMGGCHGRPQDDGHTHGTTGSSDELPTIAVTRFTERTELFMEYPAFVVGESGRSAIHITDLRDFSPLTEGETIVTLRASDGREFEFRDGPSRPGIFGVDLEMQEPGVYEMALRVEAPDLRDVHELGPVTVYESASAVPEVEEEDGGISFLKEQQWTLEFGTTLVATHDLRAGVAVPATVRPRSGGDASLTAPVPGRIASDAEVPVPGTRVRSGEVLVRMIPRFPDARDTANLRADLIEAEQALLLARQEHDRAKRLVEARALPARRLDEAQAALTASKARHSAAQERWDRFESLQSTGGDAKLATFTIRAPFDGVLAEVRLTPGASIDENDFLLRVVDPDQVHIVGTVPESVAATMGSIAGGELDAGGRPPVALGAPLAINPVVDPIARTAEVRFAFDNRESRLRVGQSVELRLFVGDVQSGPGIPESAVIDDGGRPVVFVQTGGESFERRPVVLGSRGAGYVRVVDGVENGERVVHRGAYLIRLAAMSTQIPAHGHVH